MSLGSNFDMMSVANKSVIYTGHTSERSLQQEKAVQCACVCIYTRRQKVSPYSARRMQQLQLYAITDHLITHLHEYKKRTKIIIIAALVGIDLLENINRRCHL